MSRQAAIDHIVNTRLGRWGKMLKEQGATPVILFGLEKTPKGRRINVMTAHKISEAELIKLLERAIAGFKKGKL